MNDRWIKRMEEDHNIVDDLKEGNDDDDFDDLTNNSGLLCKILN